MNSWILLAAAIAAPLSAQSTGADLFEKSIRPVLANKCYGCHSSKSPSPMGGLVLDTPAGLRKGGANGPVVVPGDAAASRLIRALSYSDPQLRMPPTGKLADAEIAAFEQWIAAGATDPRQDVPAAAPVAARRGMDLETGRKWWSFQPVRELPAPKVKASTWPKKKIDSFLLAKLEAQKLKPSPQADPATLIRRAYLDLTGLKPTYEEVEAFARDRSPDAYPRLIERLLASPQYGERWGRYWLDVARFAEDNPTSEATNPPYPFAWRYRDWVIESVNRDMPYDRFVKMQLAADQMPGTTRQDLRALGYLGAAPVYHKDGRLSKDVTETLFTDDWDEHVDAVSRGILGLTVACARCHDHKFDPITTKDYYGLAGVFASTVQVPRPLEEVDAETETRFMWAAQQLFHLNYISNLMKNEPGSKPEEAAKKSQFWGAEAQKIRADMEFLKAGHPRMYAYLNPPPRPPTPPDPPAGAPAATVAQRRRQNSLTSTQPFVNAVFDAGVWVDGSDSDLTIIDVKPGTPRDLSVLRGGNVANPGEPAPRHFPTVLSKGDPAFHNGSGRLELSEKIFSDAAPLAARVIVNRVWAWHFGKPLVATLSDFGAQGEKPTHPELLDDLAARFMASGWSLKWLHREIMLSAAYRQSSKPRPEAAQADPTNRLVWRMNPRRLDIEAYRDSILQSTGSLNAELGGPSADLDAPDNLRRTVYGRISRGRTNTLLRLYDFSDPTQHNPAREQTTTPLQQLFVMNSAFMEDQAAALVKRVESEPDTKAKILGMYHHALARDPTPRELDLTMSYLAAGTLEQFAQALLSANEVIFWP
jgi:Protein of unknown function (DUF1553)/Protein of unknown function (DUF1549)/Planctomycete cytochrome C